MGTLARVRKPSPAERRVFIKDGETLPTKVRLVKAMVFPMIMYGCESWDCEEG